MKEIDKRVLASQLAEKVFGFMLGGGGYPLDGPPASPYGFVSAPFLTAGSEYTIQLRSMADSEEVIATITIKVDGESK